MRLRHLAGLASELVGAIDSGEHGSVAGRSGEPALDLGVERAVHLGRQ
jgi:hypothetical protein